MDRATAQGFQYGKSEWANFGQGAPEVGPLPGASPRPGSIDLTSMGDAVNEYGPTAGVKELRQAVANLYNETYRQGKASKYTDENVCIVPGGRAGLIRVAAVIGVGVKGAIATADADSETGRLLRLPNTRVYGLQLDAVLLQEARACSDVAVQG